MPLAASLFLAGILIFNQRAQLFHGDWLYVFIFLLPAIYYTCRWRSRLLLSLISLLCGFLWASLRADLFYHDSEQLDTVQNRDVIIEGRIVSLPVTNQRRTRFVLELDRIDHDGRILTVQKRMLLSWYGGAPALKAGQYWRLLARIRHAHGFLNPGGFDYEAWLFRQGVHAIGYVRSTAKQVNDYLTARYPDEEAYPELNRQLDADKPLPYIDRVRQYLYDRITRVLQDDDKRGLILALALGERQDISQSQWQVMRNTGTSHLMAISGLHIGLVAGISFIVCRHVWRVLGTLPRMPFLHSLFVLLPPVRLAALLSLIPAASYAALAGFSVPTQRALLMVSVVMLAMVFHYRLKPSNVIAFALLLVLLMDPFSSLDPGFWLSFLAVTVILFGMGNRVGGTGLWWKWGRVQFVVLVGLFPLLLLFFNQVPLLSPVANIVAVPWVSFVTVPLILVGSVLAVTHAGVSLLSLASLSFDVIWLFLDVMSRDSFLHLHQHAPVAWTLLPAVVGVAWLLFPAGVPARIPALILLLPVMLVKPDRPGQGEMIFTVLDVGQGLAAVVQTQHHTLVYDSGSAYSPRFNSGESIIVPYLRSRGIDRVNLLMISHADSDHAGGMHGVLDNIEVERIVSGEPSALDLAYIPVRHCNETMSWQWDGVAFDVLYPPEMPSQRSQLLIEGNNASCVLKISSPMGTILLTGDIEKPAEYYLYKQYIVSDEANSAVRQLKTDILVAPHHGSKTSSTARFISAVRPKIVVIPVGYANRFGLPDEAVRKRYEKVGSRVLQTSQSGAIEIRLDGRHQAPRVSQSRPANRRFYHHQVLH